MEGIWTRRTLLLGIMAAVNVIEALVLVAVGVMAYRLYTQAMRTVRELEERRIAPLVTQVNALMTRVDGILVDVGDVTARVNRRTGRVDSAIRSTMDRVDETAGRVRESVAHRVHRVLGLVNGARSAFDDWFNERRASSEAPGHA